MSTVLDLTSMLTSKTYTVSGFTDETTEYARKLHKMGFIPGTAVRLAPVKMSDPLIVQIRGSRVALRKKEAQQVLIKEI